MKVITLPVGRYPEGLGTLTTMVFHIGGMTCDHCVRILTAWLTAVDGVDDSVVSLADGTARVVLDADRCGPQEIVAAVRKAGFQITGFSQAD